MEPSPIMNECAHCRREMLRSCLMEEVKEGSKDLKLFCTFCNKEYLVPNTEKQRSAMKFEFGKPFATESIFSVTQLGIGDVLKYKSSRSVPLDHYAVCLEANRESETIKVCELKDFSTLALITDQWVSMDELRQAKATVYRFQPLDCLPLQDTMKRAQEPSEHSKISLSPKKKFQFFGNWCKTNRFESLDREEVSFFKALGQAIRHPVRSFREFNNLGRDVPGFDDGLTGSGWSNTTEGWSSEKTALAKKESESLEQAKGDSGSVSTTDVTLKPQDLLVDLDEGASEQPKNDSEGNATRDGGLPESAPEKTDSAKGDGK